MKLTTIWDALYGPRPESGEIPLDKLTSSDAITRALDRAASADRGAIGRALRGTIVSRCRDLLDDPVEGRILQAFAAYRELLVYTDARRYPPEKTNTRKFGERRIQFTLSPRIEVRVDGVQLAAFTLQATLELVLKSVVLTISAGRIRAITVGEVGATGKLEIEDQKVYESPEQKVFEGFERELKDGIPIAPWNESAPSTSEATAPH